MGDHQQEIGRKGEDLAAEYLQNKSYSILERNYWAAPGEIDLVALRDLGRETILVFVEVKARTSDSFGYPEQSITRRKWEHMLSAIDSFLEDHPQYEYDWRIDVIAIQGLSADQPTDIKHYENVIFRYDTD